ncbi:MAG: DUF4199 domain-containing protein [Candidatus Cyclobacteriaceae bacterium M2_1C_046]
MEENVSLKSVAIKYGLILGIISILFFMIGVVTGDPNATIYRWLGVILTIALIVLAHREYKKEGDGFMTYGQGLGLGTLVALVSSVISSLFMYVYIKFIDDNYMSNMRQMQIEQFEEQGMTDEQIEMGLEMAEMFSSPEMILLIGIIGGVFFGFIISLIISAFTKNSNPELSV